MEGDQSGEDSSCPHQELDTLAPRSETDGETTVLTTVLGMFHWLSSPHLNPTQFYHPRCPGCGEPPCDHSFCNCRLHFLCRSLHYTLVHLLHCACGSCSLHHVAGFFDGYGALPQNSSLWTASRVQRTSDGGASGMSTGKRDENVKSSNGSWWDCKRRSVIRR